MEKTQFAAIVPAAGLSSRMGSFKPLLPVGDRTALHSILHLLRTSGVEEIAVVTGYRAEDIRYALAGEEVHLLYNSDYKKSHMFDSIKMGFAKMHQRAAHLILWPVDIPAVSQDTVEKLLHAAAETERQVVLPCHKGICGHPVIFSEDTYETVLQHDGKEGLHGALRKLNTVTEVVVDDPFVLMDMDTQDDYRRLVAKKQEWDETQQRADHITPFHFSLEVSLGYGEPFFDQKLVLLLEWVQKTGSLKKACEEMGIAYSYGWKTIKKAEALVGFPLLCKVTGGVGGGGSTLTAECRQLIEAYQRFCKEIMKKGQESFSRCFHWYAR